uniref:Uncharacterized protein n=1 Tax=Fagus sylvatica TaxID=28930 RepID=A0A2N9FSX4_FAGSY
MKINIISTENIKPSSPTPDHLRSYKISLLDQLAPPFYVPLILFYSADEFRSNNIDHTLISDQLKKSLSATLTHFYPLAGSLKGNAFVECDDEGVSYVEARVNIDLSMILQNPDMDLLIKFLPLDPYKMNDKGIPMSAFQVNIFNCGSIAIGVCISHQIADGATLATFLNAWSKAAMGESKTIIPSLDLASLFPPKDINVKVPSGVISEEKTVTRRFVFDATSLALLKDKVGHANPTRVEAVTSLHMENRHVYQIRKAIKKIDNDYIEKLQGDNVLEAFESKNELFESVSKKEAEMYRFSSWIRFPFYDIDFGFGKPIWACTTTVPIKNIVVLMSTKSGDGIEAWVTLTEYDMAKFEHHHEILEFVSSTEF